MQVPLYSKSRNKAHKDAKPDHKVMHAGFMDLSVMIIMSWSDLVYVFQYIPVLSEMIKLYKISFPKKNQVFWLCLRIYFPIKRRYKEINSKRIKLPNSNGMFEIPFYSPRCKTNSLLDHFPTYLGLFPWGTQRDLHQIENHKKN